MYSKNCRFQFIVQFYAGHVGCWIGSLQLLGRCELQPSQQRRFFRCATRRHCALVLFGALPVQKVSAVLSAKCRPTVRVGPLTARVYSLPFSVLMMADSRVQKSAGRWSSSKKCRISQRSQLKLLFFALQI